MTCSDRGPFDGGTYNNPTIVAPEITNGTAVGMTLDAGTITGGVTLDERTAADIANAVFSSHKTVSSSVPYKSEGLDVPTSIIGEDRTQVLGKPAGYIEVGDYLIPVYRRN
jgi:hypothetical protein